MISKQKKNTDFLCCFQLPYFTEYYIRDNFYNDENCNEFSDLSQELM